MDQPRAASDQRPEGLHERGCEAELHLRLCARTLTTGHLQFRWRVERVDHGEQDGASMEGSFGPFDLPHECGQEVAALVRSWMKDATRRIRERSQMPDDDEAWEQLTLRDFVPD